jgi:hypothetical protein
MMSKWSLKSAEHKAARLRNNQRRQREKVKRYVAELEERLADTQQQLEVALAQISELTEKMDRSTIRSTLPGGSMQSTAQDRSAAVVVANSELPRRLVDGECVSCPVGGSDYVLSVQTGAQFVQDGIERIAIQNTLPFGESRPSGNPVWKPSPMLSMDTVVFGQRAVHFESGPEVEEQDCCDLQPVGSNESTTRCQDAYSLIAQQNFKGLDAHAIHGWLEPGFRRAIIKGDGCRVGTGLLFALLDFIS